MASLPSETYAGAGERTAHSRGAGFRDFFNVLLFSTRGSWERDVLRGSKEFLWAKWRDMPAGGAPETTSIPRTNYDFSAMGGGSEAYRFKRFYRKLAAAGPERTDAKSVLTESFHHLWDKWQERMKLDEETFEKETP